jgi:hypothetical protein
VSDLPALVPSTAAVDAAARRYALNNDPSMRGMGFDLAPAHVQNWYRGEALTLLNAAGPHLLADVLEYAVTNHKAFEFSAHTADQLLDALLKARAAAAPETSDPWAIPG